MRRGKIVAVVALVVCLSLPEWALGCSCVWAGPFSNVAHGQELIVLGEVLSHYRNSMDVRVIDVIKGAEQRRTIRRTARFPGIHLTAR